MLMKNRHFPHIIALSTYKGGFDYEKNYLYYFNNCHKHFVRVHSTSDEEIISSQDFKENYEVSSYGTEEKINTLSDVELTSSEKEYSDLENAKFFLENNSNKEYHYSKAYFEIEAEQSETWYQLTQLYDPSKDNEDDAVINPTERLSLPFDISSVYGELPSGHYRIIVSISYFESPKDWDYDTYYLACEFTLK